MDKKKFLFVSLDALIGDTAWQVAREGHEVRYYIENAESRDVADGFVAKSDDWERDARWADVVVFDDVLGQGAKAKALRDAGKAVVGGTPYTDRLEDDRAFGQEELKKVGIPIIPYREFTDFDEAIAHVRDNPGEYVIKPSGEAQNIKRLLFVGQEDDGKDVIQVLEAYKRAWTDHVKVFQLQRRVKGVEIAVGAFFNGREYVSPININFEHKKLFPGNLGPSTGEMGTLMYWGDRNRIFNQTLARLEPKLKEEGYVGYIDLNCIVNASGIHPLEFTARFGYPTISIQAEGILNPMADVLHHLAHGTDFKLKTRRGFQIGVRVVVPPYPFDDPHTFETLSKNAVVHFQKPGADGVHIEDVKLVNGQWVLAGTSGVALVVCGLGTTVRQAQAQAYARVRNIIIPSMYYRTDIGDRWFDDCDRLHTWGYLRDE